MPHFNKCFAWITNAQRVLLIAEEMEEKLTLVDVGSVALEGEFHNCRITFSKKVVKTNKKGEKTELWQNTVVNPVKHWAKSPN